MYVLTNYSPFLYLNIIWFKFKITPCTIDSWHGHAEEYPFQYYILFEVLLKSEQTDTANQLDAETHAKCTGECVDERSCGVDC